MMNSMADPVTYAFVAVICIMLVPLLGLFLGLIAISQGHLEIGVLCIVLWLLFD